MKSEQNRIDECVEWRREYRKTDRGDKLSEVSFYSLPIDLTKGWTEEIDRRGNFTVKGLSALKNDIQVPTIGLFPEDIDVPKDYSLIRILESEKQQIPNSKNNKGWRAIIIKDIEVLPDDHLYKDVPFEEESVKDILMEGLNGDEFTAKSLQSPLLSSPQGFSKSGGIGMASMLSSGPMADELIRQLQVILPPEYRMLDAPDRDKKGAWKRINGREQQIKFKVAQKRTPNSRSQVSASKATNYAVVNREMSRKLDFGGEYSFVGSLVPGGSKVDTFNEMFHKFTQTEVTTFHLEELRYADVDLERLQQEIMGRENLWLNLVYSRQFQPGLKDKINEDSFKSDIRDEWEAFMPQMGYEDIPQYLLDVKADESWKNMKRIGQSIARADGRGTVKKKDLKEARNMISSSLEELVMQEETRKARKQVKKRDRNDRYASVQDILQSTRATTDQIWRIIKPYNYFDDKNDLQGFLDWLKRNKHIIRDQKGRYRWN